MGVTSNLDLGAREAGVPDDLPPAERLARARALMQRVATSPAGASAMRVADRWRYSRHLLATLRDVEDRKAALRAEYGWCEVVVVRQDSGDPEWQFRVPLSADPDALEGLRAHEAHDQAELEPC